MNWATGENPLEINDGRYIVSTDIYFLGRLFEKIIKDTQNAYFDFESILIQMTQVSTQKRFSSFYDIKKSINEPTERVITDEDKQKYNNLADILIYSISELFDKPKFDFDGDSILRKLENILKQTAWETKIKNISLFVGCFFESIDCKYTLAEWDDYGNDYDEFTINVEVVKNFRDMFIKLNSENRINLLENLYYNRIFNIPIVKHTTQNTFHSFLEDDELPF